jgi:hypothetical protein
MTSETWSDCTFCSVISKINGEDPIGTAGNHDHWLIVELAQPWSAKLLEEPTIKPLIGLIQTLILRHQVKLRPIAIARDREYSQPGYTRILYYQRPPHAFAHFRKQEFLVPEAEAIPLLRALLQQIVNQPHDLATFRSYQVDTQSVRELLVCTHGNVDVACSRFGHPIYQQLRDQYASNAQGQLRVWRCSHFGGHQFAPTLIDLPSGRYWGRLESHLLDALVYQVGEVSQLRSCYRGWSGLSKFEQIAERELWQQEGWKWFSYDQLARTIAVDPGQWHFLQPLLQWIPVKRLQFLLKQRWPAPKWAIVKIEYQSADGEVAGSYEAKIELRGQVMTALASSDRLKLQSVNQYQATHLTKIT